MPRGLLLPMLQDILPLTPSHSFNCLQYYSCNYIKSILYSLKNKSVNYLELKQILSIVQPQLESTDLSRLTIILSLKGGITFTTTLPRK